MKTVSVKDFGAAGDGITDDSIAFQRALDSQLGCVTIPKGTYRITSTLRMPSETFIRAAHDARIFSCGETPKKRGDFLLTNADTVNGNHDITIHGGIWDGNNDGRLNKKPDNLFLDDAWSGAVLNFMHVRNLRLEDLTVANSVTYNIRLSCIDGFVFRKIRFQSERTSYNQDGLHFGGCCRNGRVRDVRAISDGQTNDDLLALNADDCIDRLENRDMVCGPIENISISLVRAENCHSAIRLLSVNSTIRNIRIRDIDVGVRKYAINADAARYCRTPLFRDADFPNGVGHIDNVRIENFRFHTTMKDGPSPFCMETNSYGLSVKRFMRDTTLDVRSDIPTLLARNLKPGTIVREDEGSLSIHSPKPEWTHPVRFQTIILLEKGSFQVTSPFGYRTHPVTGERGSFHAGVDGALWDGRMLVETGICAWADGTVVNAEDSEGNAGTFVVIDHGNEHVSRYFHLEHGSLRVKRGDKIRKGSLLGWMGKTGRATGEHIHFQLEIKRVPVNPIPYLTS